MKIIKRNGAEVAFDLQKIINAVRKANSEVSEGNRSNSSQTASQGLRATSTGP